mmetsp:Transcript_15578/g.37927  ORF Transcript_15578/g.37927 Transcript_15578/m.37927 type:complete len:84 (-) Transcript_15578:146-397(-)
MGMPMGMGMPMSGMPMGMGMGMPMMGGMMGGYGGATETPGAPLAPADCMRYGVPMGAVWGGASTQQAQEAPAEDDGGVNGTQV